MKTILIVCILIFVYFNQNSYVDMKEYETKTIQVEIKGEVNHPGVYEMEYNALVKDLIDTSGGINESADTSSINQSKSLKNKDVIVIGSKREIKKISINSADVVELSTLPSVGPATAQKIIDYRNEYGPFQSVEDIMQVKGIKNKLFEKIKEYIAL